MPLKIEVKDLVVLEKEYDGKNSAQVISWKSNIIGDEVALIIKAYFDTHTVNAKEAHIEFEISGDRVQNYIAPQKIVIAKDGWIKPRRISLVDVSAENKVYDGAAVVKLKGGRLIGVLEPDNVYVVLGPGYAESVDAGQRFVSCSFTLAGADADNYVVDYIDPIIVTINKRPIKIKIDDKTSKVNEPLVELTYQVIIQAGLCRERYSQ